MQNIAQERWSEEQAWAWYRAQPWLCGFNYVPSTAINTTEMWQRPTFDLQTIERELGWAKQIGFNSCRIFLQYLVWEADGDGLLHRLDQFLAVADEHGLSTMICLFDDCAFSGKQPYLGPQDGPVPGVHNSGWVPSPGHARVADQESWPQLEAYVTSILSRFRYDRRVLLWDLYNEPGNVNMGDRSLPLLEATFRWARAAQPQQPLTTGVWHPDLHALNETSLALSDISTFHDYEDLQSVERVLDRLKPLNRPIICTEWMRRHYGSTFDILLPVFKREGIGCCFWGLVNGRTQTHFPWDSPQGAADPQVWYHDLLRSDGTPHLPDEIIVIRSYLEAASAHKHTSPTVAS